MKINKRNITPGRRSNSGLKVSHFMSSFAAMGWSNWGQDELRLEPNIAYNERKNEGLRARQSNSSLKTSY